jgi:hypothetical protein
MVQFSEKKNFEKPWPSGDVTAIEEKAGASVYICTYVVS